MFALCKTSFLDFPVIDGIGSCRSGGWHCSGMLLRAVIKIEPGKKEDDGGNGNNDLQLHISLHKIHLRNPEKDQQAQDEQAKPNNDRPHGSKLKKSYELPAMSC